MKKILLYLLLFLSTNIYSQLSNEGLLAYYPFSGNVLDYGPSQSYHGILQGGTFVEDIAGNAGQAIRLNGTNEFVDLSAFSSGLRNNLNHISIYFEVKFDGTQDGQTILSLGSKGENVMTNVFEIELENERFQIETEAGFNGVNSELSIDEESVLLDGQWHKVLITIEDSFVTYVRDGIVIFEGIYSPAETMSPALFVGAFSAGECCFFQGCIDELQFYNRILSPDEISSLSEAQEFGNHIKLYPNPTSDIVNVQLSEPSGAMLLQLVNSNGQLIFAEKVENVLTHTIQLPAVKGIYYLQVTSLDNLNQYKTFRIVKQ
ncbi:MAG: LamG-like jellyroll fold domain-containing protein [Saprospiraceae bacterium]